MKCVKKTLLITLGPLQRHHLAGANSALPVECFPKEPFNSSSAQQRLAPATRPPAGAVGFWGLASIASNGGQEFGHSGLKAAREAQEEWKHLETSLQRTAGRSCAVPAASPATAGQSLGIKHQTQFVACPALPPWLRRCSRAGSGSRSPWGTPPACETTPSYGWCGRRGRR